MTTKDDRSTVAREAAVSSGHPLATSAALAMLDKGGNAIDAGVAGGIVLGVVLPDLVNVAGVAPIILRLAGTGEVVTIDGLGVWPAKADVHYFEQHTGGQIPQGLLRTVVPAAPAAWITALTRYGTLTFADVAQAAIRHAREGFAVHALLADFIAEHEADYRRTDETARIFLPEGRPPRVGERFVQADLANTLQTMVDAEMRAVATGGSREQGLQAAYDAFYTGEIAQRICAHHRAHGGWLTVQDMADYRVRLETPVVARFEDIDFHCCGPWCQGISMAQMLTMMAAADLASLERGSADQVHRLVEMLKRVFADREAVVADPAFVAVPVEALLDAGYCTDRVAGIDPLQASPGMPPAGIDTVAGEGFADAKHKGSAIDGQTEPGAAPDTSHIGVIDRHGNMFAATPSDTSCDTEVIPGTGLSPSSRGSQSRGIAGSINAVAPGKRPRLTPNPVLALKDGQPFMTIGTPGGDVQVQAMAQVLANHLVFGMPLQAAIDAPRFASYSFPSSFAPNDCFPGLLMMEPGFGDAVTRELQARGHDVKQWAGLSWKAGGVCAIRIQDGALHAASDPRRAGNTGGR